MFITGLADEAGADIETQIKATKELGWSWIEARNVGDKNIHDISDMDFDRAVGKLEEAGIRINAFGSTIANWGKDVHDPFSISEEEAKRAIPRMKRLGVKMIRVMSYKLDKSKGPEEQDHAERFRRLGELFKRFQDAGILMAHENCWNWGGMGPSYALRLIEAVPGIGWIFDTGNPVGMPDYIKPEPRPQQSAWEFYLAMKPYISHVQIKDGIWDAQKGEANWCWAGEGQGDTWRIVEDLVKSGYQGGLCIEPHLAIVYHDPKAAAAAEERYSKYVEYGKRFEKKARELGARF
jgi:sugar phosphate isomerase/epimerase